MAVVQKSLRLKLFDVKASGRLAHTTMLEDVGLLAQVHSLIFPGLTPTKASNAQLAHKLRALASIADTSVKETGDTAQKPPIDTQSSN